MKTVARLLLVSLITCYTLVAVAQEKKPIVKIKGEFQVTWEQDKESKEDAKKRAEQFARINALQNAFGTVVIQGNSIYTKNVNKDNQVETSSTFNMIGNTFVKGEIIEVKELKFNEIKWSQKVDRKKVEKIDIKCIIKATAREITETSVNFECYTLSGDMKNNKTTTYYDGDQLYLYFQSPVSGYLSVFIDDNKHSMRILPYQQMPSKYENGIPVEADKEYIFFSTLKDYFEDGVFINELELFTEENSDQDLNRVYILFSKEPINKPRLKAGLNEDLLTKKEKEGDYTVPKALKSELFLKWLIKNQYIREDLQKKIIDISIEKK